MAGAQCRLGIVDKATYVKITAYKSEPMAAIREMMEGFHQSGAIDKQTMREFDDACLHPAPAVPMALDDESGPAGASVVPSGGSRDWPRGERAPTSRCSEPEGRQ